MSIRFIQESHWPAISRVQAEAYSQIEPESVAVLQSKWSRSPDLCFVYEHAQCVQGYVLAHRWHCEPPPKLYQLLPKAEAGDLLFLHDLALSSRIAGQGVGKALVNRVLAQAKAQGLTQARLVSIQGSEGFWQQFGFQTVQDVPVCASYGEDAQLMACDL